MTALAAIHVAKKQLGLDDDTYRGLLVRVTGKDSAKAMTEAERLAVVEHMRKAGFKPASKAGRKQLEGRFALKLQALWIAGWNLGVVRDRNDSALVAFVKRQANVDHVRFLHDSADARSAIEGLKDWLARQGGVDWSLSKTRPAWMQADGYRIAWAQWRILVPGATAIGNGRDFLKEVERLTGKAEVASLTAKDWQPVMNDFGARIRARSG